MAATKTAFEEAKAKEAETREEFQRAVDDKKRLEDESQAAAAAAAEEVCSAFCAGKGKNV